MQFDVNSTIELHVVTIVLSQPRVTKNRKRLINSLIHYSGSVALSRYIGLENINWVENSSCRKKTHLHKNRARRRLATITDYQRFILKFFFFFFEIGRYLREGYKQRQYGSKIDIRDKDRGDQVGLSHR